MSRRWMPRGRRETSSMAQLTRVARAKRMLLKASGCRSASDSLISGVLSPQMAATPSNRRSAAPKVGAAGERGWGCWSSDIVVPPATVSGRRGGSVNKQMSGPPRSEERRVGKEGGCRGGTERYKKKQESGEEQGVR